MTHGSRELDEDAAKLAAMGADPGPTISDIFGAWDVRVLVCEECGGDGGWDYQAGPHRVAHQTCRGCDGKGHIEVEFLPIGIEDAESV
jgi:hypothetical protein